MTGRSRSTTASRAQAATSSSREALVSAARTLFTKQGYEATSVVDITQLAGTSVGSLYYHFGGKAQIFLAMHEAYVQRQDERMRDAVRIVRSAGVTDPRRLFLASTRAYLMGVWEDRDVSKVLADGETPSGFGSVSREWNDKWTQRNASVLSSSDSPLEVKAVAAAVAGAVGAWAKDIVQFPTFDEASQYIDNAVAVAGRVLGFGDAGEEN